MIVVHTAFHTAFASRESRTEYSCTASVAPGRNSLRKDRNWASGPRGCGSGMRRGCRRTERRHPLRRGPRRGCARIVPSRGHRLAAASASMPDDARRRRLSLRREDPAAPRWRLRSAAGIEKTKTRCPGREAACAEPNRSARGIRDCGDQAVVGGGARVERGGHLCFLCATRRPSVRVGSFRASSRDRAASPTLPQQQHGGHQCAAEQESSTGMSNGNRMPLVWRSS